MTWRRLQAENHRGVVVPRVLGIVLAAAATASTALVAASGGIEAAGWTSLGGLLLVFSAGLVDDLAQAGPRGLRNHLRALATGHVTTGIVKLVVIVGSAVVIVATQPDRAGLVPFAGVILLAASANVWNGLDVAPGRALKAFLVPASAFAVWGVVANAPAVLGLIVAAPALLPFDLRERAMLGDAGANLLGSAAGLALYDVLSDVGVAIAALIAVALNVVAESVSFSRLIDRWPPVRWLDRLGRRR